MVSQTDGMAVRAIAYGNGVYAAVGLGSKIFYSSDAIQWQSTTSSETDLEQLTFGNGVFVATTRSGVIAYSLNGASWTSVGKVAPGAIWSAAFGNGAFVAISFSGNATNMTVLRSTNGADWTTHVVDFPSMPIDYPTQQCPSPRFCPPPTPATYAVRSLAFGDGVFGAAVYYPSSMVGGYAVKFLKSTDGLAWQWADSGGYDLQRFTEFLNDNLTDFAMGRFFHFYSNVGNLAAPEVKVSSNLADWTSIFFPQTAPGTVPGGDTLASSGSSIVVVGPKGYIAFGPSIENLTVLVGGSLGKLSSVASTGQRLVGAGPSRLMELSVDGGTTWTQTTLPTEASDIEAVAYANNNFVGVGVGGTVVRSALGDTWAKRLSNTTSDLHDLVFGNNLWVAVGNNGTVITSPDASFFSLQNSQTQVRLNSVTFGNGQYVAVGADGAVLNSSNGTVWTAQGTDEAVTLNGVAFGNGRFVAVGNAGTTHWTTDLTTWHTVKIGGAGNLADVAFANGVFAAIEEGTDRVFTSVEGEIWTLQSLEGSLNFGVDSTDGRLFVTGDRGVIWAYVQSPNIVLGGGKDAQGKFKLIISAPVAGTYRVYSTTDVTGSVWTPRDLVVVSGQAAWTDPNPMAAPTFYEVRKE